MIISVLIALFILSFMVFFHELGHFLSAIYFKIPVEEFAIGMGPKLFDIKGKLATYSLRIVPLGGYVKIKGMELGEEEDIFRKKKFHEKFIVVIAGVVMNFLLAFLIFLTMNLINGHINFHSTVVNKIENGKSIFKLGDKILYVEGIKVNNWRDFINLILNNEKNPMIEIEVERNNKKEIIKIENSEDKIKLFSYAYPWKRSFLGSIEVSFRAVKNGIKNSFGIVKKLAKRELKTQEVSGPIGIIKQIKDNTNDIWKLLLIAAYISLSLGVFNLFPFPALDGGRLIFIILEALGIKVNKKVEEIVHLIGFIILILLTIIVGRNDILKLRK